MRTTTLFNGILFFLLLTLQYTLWFSWAGKLELTNLYKNIDLMKQANAELKQYNLQQTQLISEIYQANIALEDVARRKLGLIKDDEILIQWKS